MRFNGSSGVEVRPPSNLEDLKAYTSLSFFLQRPQKRSDMPQRASDRFVLYLGNKDVRIFWDLIWFLELAICFEKQMGEDLFWLKFIATDSPLLFFLIDIMWWNKCFVKYRLTALLSDILLFWSFRIYFWVMDIIIQSCQNCQFLQ